MVLLCELWSTTEQPKNHIYNSIVISNVKCILGSYVTWNIFRQMCKQLNKT